jgi:hypothetical protein
MQRQPNVEKAPRLVFSEAACAHPKAVWLAIDLAEHYTKSHE